MKVHAFKVEELEENRSLVNILNLIQNETELFNRIREVRQKNIRVESIYHDQNNNHWYLDFVRIRKAHGPGKVGSNSEIIGFDFDEDEGFGEETAALYDANTGYIVVQYNHFGVRAETMAAYFNVYDETVENHFNFSPKFEEDIERKLYEQGIRRKIVYGIDIGKISENDRRHGRPLSEAISYGQENNADNIRIEISVKGDRRRNLNQRGESIINPLLNFLRQKPEAISKFEVTGKEDIESKAEVLDLIAQRLCVEFTDLNLGPDLRYPRNQRWRALLRAKNGWNNILR